MLNENKAIEPASNSVRKLWEKHGIKDPMRFLGFCLSLLPLPAIQQAGQALDRHLSDKAFEAELSALWDEIKAANGLVARVETIEEAIKEIAKTIQSNPQLGQKTESFIGRLGTTQEEFLVLTENHSYQALVNTIVHADISAFVARNSSTNVIEHSTINSEKTHLHATDGSKNYVHGTTFQGTGGAVSMQGITTQGPISVQGSGVGFGPGGALIFGGNPNEVFGNCHFCNASIRVDKRVLANYREIQCHSCKRVMQFKCPDTA